MKTVKNIAILAAAVVVSISAAHLSTYKSSTVDSEGLRAVYNVDNKPIVFYKVNGEWEKVILLSSGDIKDVIIMYDIAAGCESLAVREGEIIYGSSIKQEFCKRLPQ